MATERWGTYSVVDHKAPQAFVADVMLYDRLAIPIPAQGDLVSWQNREVQRQEKMLRILGDRAWTVEWDQVLRNEWKSQWDAGIRVAKMANRKDIHPQGTPDFLLTKLPKGVTGVAAAVLFKSENDALNAVNWKKKNPDQQLTFGEVNGDNRA